MIPAGNNGTVRALSGGTLGRPISVTNTPQVLLHQTPTGVRHTLYLTVVNESAGALKLRLDHTGSGPTWDINVAANAHVNVGPFTLTGDLYGNVTTAATLKVVGSVIPV